MQEFYQQKYQHLTTSNNNPFVHLHLWSKINLQILQDRSMKFISILRFEHTHTISPSILQKPSSGTCWFQCGCETRWICNVKLNKVQTTPIGSTYQIYYLPFGWFPICVHVLEKIMHSILQPLPWGSYLTKRTNDMKPSPPSTDFFRFL